jgi:uncharacterized protein YraI
MHSHDTARHPSQTATLSRRSAIRALTGAGIAAFAVTTLGRTAGAQTSDERQTPQLYATTDYLNLRSAPGTRHGVIIVIPPKAIITLNAMEQNGFASANYDGYTGWVHRDYIVPAGFSSGDPVFVGAARTTSDVNLRSGPGTGHQVLRVVPSGTWVDVSDTIENGFRYVVHDGLAGWMADRYLGGADDGGQGETFTTTADLNLRAEPSTSAAVHLVMPEGSTVQAGAGWSNGFRQVTYQGILGWAHTSYLN